MTIHILTDEMGKIKREYHKSESPGKDWVSTEESDWPDISVGRDEVPIYYYDEETSEITVVGERKVTEGIEDGA